MNNSIITEFIKDKLNNNEFILRSFIFGSVAKGVTNPNDCDLFIVTNQTPFLKNWKLFLESIEDLKKDFEFKFSLKLNVTINTECEFSEYSPFKERILKRKFLEIFTK